MQWFGDFLYADAILSRHKDLNLTHQYAQLTWSVCLALLAMRVSLNLVVGRANYFGEMCVNGKRGGCEEVLDDGEVC